MPAPGLTGSLASVTTASLGDAAADGVSWFVVQIVGTFVGTVGFTGTVDGTNYKTLAFVTVGSTAPGTPVTSITAPDICKVDANGLTDVKVNVSAYTSGTITYFARPTRG
jgi:hypothetical protein